MSARVGLTNPTRTDTGWLEHAACATVHVEFVMTPGDLPAELHAKQVCSQCLVRIQCLNHALAHNEAGVWGGKSEDERRELKRRRQKAVAA